MRTRPVALVVALWAQLAAAQSEVAAREPAPSRFELGLPAEVTLVGLSAGVRPELLLRIGDPSARTRLRVAVGVFVGADQVFVPISLGYRGVFRQGLTVQPFVGAGAEGQFRFSTDLPPVRSLGVYLEGGVAFAITDHWSLAVAVTTDLMVLGAPGFGFGPRVALGYKF